MKQKTLHIDGLLKRAQQGDRSAFQEIYGLYYDRLIRYGCSMNGEKTLVHDAIQDLFVWLLQHPEKLKEIHNLDTYLFKALRRNVGSTLQKIRKKKAQARELLGKQVQAATIESSLINSESLEAQSIWVSRQINRLSPHQKEIIYLRFYENLTYDEIATIFSVSNQVVRNSVFRAIKKLRKNASEEKKGSLQGIYGLFSFLM